MSMTSVLTAITTLIADNILTIPGLVIVLIWIALVISHIYSMRRSRDFYGILYIVLWTIVAFFCLLSAEAIMDFIRFIVGRIQGLF